MKKVNLIVAILNTLILFYCVLAVVLDFFVWAAFLTGVGIAFSIFLVFLIIHLFRKNKKRRTIGNAAMIVLSTIILVVNFGGFAYNGVVSVINGNELEIIPTFVMAIYSIFTLFSWGMVLHLERSV